MEKSVGNNEDGNGRVWDKVPLSHSCPSYIILTHPYPKPGIGHVDEYPSSFIEKKKMINSSLHCLNSNVYLCLDGEVDFSKTNNITSIQKNPQ